MIQSWFDIPNNWTLLNARLRALVTSLKTQGTWSDPLQLGASYLWADATGKLRIKTTLPTSDTDGTVVGTQV